MPLPTFDAFESEARRKGFTEVLERRWPPGAVIDDHAHPFELEALLVEGEMWLSDARRTRHLKPGDRFVLAANEPHAERYGDEGAVYWVARRPAPAAG